MKSRERERECREKHQKKWKERKDDDEEDAPMVNNMDKDKDYDPDDDPEAQFVVEDQELEDEDTFEVEKHVHVVNFDEAGDYLVAMNRYMEAFAKIVRRGKDDVMREYKKLIKFVKLMIEKLGAYYLIEAADTDAVFETIIDLQCIAWRHALHGTKTGNSKEIQQVEEKRWKAERSVEEREVIPDKEVKTFAETMEVKSKSSRADMVMMIKRYFGHVARAHEEAASAAKIAQLLIIEVDENSWVQIVANGMRPLIMMEVPEMMRQASSIKTECERQQKAEMMRGQPIEEIVKEQNMPRPVERWAESKIMSPSSYLAAAVYYFLFNTVDQKKTVANKAVVDQFKISRSNLHRITNGRKYARGSITMSRKLKSLQEFEEHGESMEKIVKVKPKPKAKKTVTVTKTAPKLIGLPFLDNTPAEGMRRSCKKKDGSKKDESDDTKPMVH